MSILNDMWDNDIVKLRQENHDLKEQLKYFIPRRRVRRVYKQLKKILNEDIQNENKQYIDTLVKFINKIEKEGEQIAGQDIKQAIEHLLSMIDLEVEDHE